MLSLKVFAAAAASRQKWKKKFNFIKSMLEMKKCYLFWWFAQ
jgi:hypothetical protein